MFDWRHELVDHRPARTTSGRSGSSSSSTRRGLAYKKKAAVNWCPADKTVLANEQVDRRPRASAAARWSSSGSWSSGSSGSPTTPTGCSPTWTTVEMDWSESTKTAQRNWIGRSEGAEIVFPIGGPADRRTDGPTDECARSGSSPPGRTRSSARRSWCWRRSIRWSTRSPRPTQRAEVEAYRERAATKDLVARKVGDREKTGVFTGGVRASTRRPASRSRSGSPTTC